MFEGFKYYIDCDFRFVCMQKKENNQIQQCEIYFLTRYLFPTQLQRGRHKLWICFCTYNSTHACKIFTF